MIAKDYINIVPSLSLSAGTPPFGLIYRNYLVFCYPLRRLT
jgi:hypothetical protein